MWAEQGINLDSAEALLQSALRQDSLNGAYLDSYAWILFKKGDVDGALLYIVKATKLITDDPVVFSHYGDILLKKGDRASALSVYKKGAGLDAEKSSAQDIADLKSKIKSLENQPPGPANPAGGAPEISKP